MSKRPATLQLLKKGKLLCSAVFPAIVETWNWLVEAFDGLKGDYDLNPNEGFIKVDRSDPTHPVIRLAKPVKTEEATPSGGGMPQFVIKDGKISGGVVCIARKYYKVSEFTPSEETGLEDGEYRLKFAFSNGWQIAIEKGSGFEDIDTSSTTSYAPLFKVKDGAIDEDYRGAIYLTVRE